MSVSCKSIVSVTLLLAASWASAGTMTSQDLDAVIEKVKPALVRIHVVETDYYDGREVRYESVGSGVVIDPRGYVITNHHVAGHATHLTCTFSNREEIEGELVGTDPLTDIAVIKLLPESEREFSIATFSDSDAMKTGDPVLALGSPMALSQSVTFGIVSNPEMVMPDWGDGGVFDLEGEDVGALVKWIGHDAPIYGGNSGGALVNLAGELVGINEIRMGLSGAIPGNLAQEVALALIQDGEILRAWFGIDFQPRLKSTLISKGVLVGGVLKDSPAQQAGLKAGDIILNIHGTDVNVRFREELPPLNQLIARCPIGEPVSFKVLREGQDLAIAITPIKREKLRPREYEIKAWGLTVRNISGLLARELKLDSEEGALVTSVRPGGPAGEAKPTIRRGDVIVEIDGKPVPDVSALRAITTETFDASDEKQPPVLAGFQRSEGRFITVVRLGEPPVRDPALEVKKAWLPVDTQVLTRDIAKHMGQPDLKGFRVVRVYPHSTAETAGIQIGDIVTAVDGEKLTASAPEHAEELPVLIRQYRAKSIVTLDLIRDGAPLKLDVELARSPRLPREMKEYRDDVFEFTVRDVSFRDRASEKWEETQAGVIVEEVREGGWASLGRLAHGDLVVGLDGQPINSVSEMEKAMRAIHDAQPKTIVLHVIRGVHSAFVELEPQWTEQGEAK